MHEVMAALRQFRKSPGFAVTVVLTIALGIGANTAIFTLVHAVLLRSLPVRNPAMLYSVGDGTQQGQSDSFPDVTNTGNFSLFSWDLYRHIRATTPEFSALAAMQSNDESMSVREGNAAGKSERTEYVSGNYFATLGIGSFAGRMLTGGDDTLASAPAAVMSYAAWQADYGGDPGVVGRTFTFQSHPVTVVGVAPSGFYGDRIDPRPPAFWLPLTSEPLLEGPQSVLRLENMNWLYMLGRIRPGVSPGALAAKISVDLRQWLQTVPAYVQNGDARLIPRQHVVLVPGGSGIQSLQQQTSEGLYLLMGLCALVLLVACANVANLLLARGSAQRADLSLRMALGASRTRLVRQMLTESVLLACLGGLVGLAVAYAGTRTILTLAFPNAPQLPINPHPSLPVLGFAFLLSLVTGVVFGIVPAWITSHADPAEALRGAARSTRDRSSLPQRSLIVFQAALSLVLLVGAGLLTRSLENLQHQDLGFQTGNRYVVRLDPAGAGYTPQTLPALYQALEQRFDAIPEVADTGLAIYSPMERNQWIDGVYIAGRPDPAPDADNMAAFDRVSPQFLASVGEPVVRGRGFTDDDTATSQMVAVVNEAFVRKFFPGANPVGRYFGTFDPQHKNAFQIVGVVANAKYANPAHQAAAMFFRPLTQVLTGLATTSDTNEEQHSLFIDAVVLHFKTPPGNVDGLVRRTVAEINPNLTVSSVLPLAFQVAGNFAQDRLISRLATLFGVLALVLAAVGLYGITAYQVARRTGEIGVRMALGATRGDVLRMVMRGAFAQVGLGLVIGVPVAVLGAQSIAGLLYGVRAWDPVSLLLGVAALLLAAAVAGLIPARRAASIEPVTALRIE